MVLNWQRVPLHSRTKGGEEIHPLKLFKQIWGRGGHTLQRWYGEPRLLGLGISINKGWFISHTDFGMGRDPSPSLSQAQTVYSLILNNNKKKKLNGDHYLICRLPPQGKRERVAGCCCRSFFLPCPTCMPHGAEKECGENNQHAMKLAQVFVI